MSFLLAISPYAGKISTGPQPCGATTVRPTGLADRDRSLVAHLMLALLAALMLVLAGCGPESQAPRSTAVNGERAQVREAADPPAGPGYGFVYRFAKYSNGAYFYTGNEGERDLVLSGNFPDFRYEGVAFLQTTQGESAPVYRFANLTNGGYFYTASDQERDFVIQTRPDMRFEGSTFSVALPSNPDAIPIYRLANLQNGAYLYTAGAAERDFAVSTGLWRAEGTAFSALNTSVVLPFVVAGFTGDLASTAGTGDGGGGDGGGSGGSGGSGGDGGAGGAGAEGAIRFADVRLYDSASRLLGSAVSDGRGLVTLRANGIVGPFLVEYVGNSKAEYFDEGLASVRNADAWVPFPATEKISVWVLDLKRGIVASALTNAAAEEIRRSGVQPVTAAMVSAANEKMRSAFNALFATSGVAVTDITRMPSLVFSLDSMRQFSTNPAGQYAQVLTSLARSAAQFNPSLPNPAREMTKQLTRDLTDGVINGQDNTGAAVASSGSKAYEPALLPQSVARQTAGTLVIATLGSGSVNPTSSVPAVACPSGSGLCYPWGTSVTLTAQPGASANFQGWSGACAGTSSCQVTMSGDKTVTATFGSTAATGFTLSVVVAGNGSVASAPTGITCGSDCSESYAPGTSVSLTATPAAGSTFTGWSGACAGLGTCITTMNAAKSLTANFALAQNALTIFKLGAGSGTVASAPAGITCGATCTAAYAGGTSVTLTATPAQGSAFTGWAGPCTGTGVCTVSMDAATSVTANFSQTSITLNVATAGTGSGAVSSSPSGIACGTDCTEPYTFGTTVFLSATPAPGSSFTGWSGDCGGIGTCVVIMDTSHNVTANFGIQGSWTWVGGSSVADSTGAYGVKGSASVNNTPGARKESVSWTDSSGSLWLFGGFGKDAPGTLGYLNDLWKYNRSTGAWTWVSGSNVGYATGVYGTRGIGSAGNMPGARYDASGWTDSAGNLWLFGGYGMDGSSSTGLDGIPSINYGYLNDLWKYSPVTNTWTWVSGSTRYGAPGVYGIKGTASLSNAPGAREGASTWIDASGNLWLFGGSGIDSAGATGYLNDLWKFSPSAGAWTWVGGSSARSAISAYGVKGIAGSGNAPGSRSDANSWADSAGNFWLFGGYGVDSASTTGALNDLWKYTPGSNAWTWVSGSNLRDIAGVYGVKGQASSSYAPGGRYGASAWADSSGNLWLSGGLGDDFARAYGLLNDVWKFNPSSGAWTWVSGSNVRNAPSNYGVKGIAGAANVPGGRKNTASWLDSSGVLWLFGGEVSYFCDPCNSTNELWKFAP